MKTNLMVSLTVAGLALPAPLWAAAGNIKPAPNIIVIMADDLGYADAGFNGGKQFATPHIDSIAENGVRCSSAYASYSVCGPSRAGFITGRYQDRFGFCRNPQYRPDDPAMGLPLDERTMAEVLKKAGYTSGIIGKWHLGAHISNHPLNRGFDFFFGHLGGGHHYFQELLTIQDSYGIADEEESYKTWILRDHEPVQITKYLTDEFSDEAVKFIERNSDRPFFLFLSYNAPHTPMEAPDAYLERFADIKNEKRRTYAAMVTVMDEGIGRVLGKLEELQVDDNTVVFFLSDNGGPTGANASDNSPLRGEKSSVYEGGFRVPFAVRWPAVLPAGATFDRPVSSLDIFATAAALAKAPLNPERPLDGVNLIPFLTGEDREPPHQTIYLRKYDQQWYAVRHGDYKLVIPKEDGTPELYHLTEDIGEVTDLFAAAPEKAEEIEKLRQAWVEELMEPRFLGLIHTEKAIEMWGRPKRW